MAIRKKPVEVSCSNCSARFRLWIPVEGQWENERVNCVRCGAPYIIRKSQTGYTLEAAAAGEAPAAPGLAPSRKEPPAEEPSEPLPKTVLVVEDDGLSRKMVENTLKELNLRVITAKNSTEALRAIGEEKIGLLVIDLYLKNPEDPEALLDGREFLEKAVASGLNVPAIVTTGKELVDDISLDPRWFELHVKGFVQKGNPFWVDDLKENVRSLYAK